MPRIICAVSLPNLSNMLKQLELEGYWGFEVGISDDGKMLIRGHDPV